MKKILILTITLSNVLSASIGPEVIHSSVSLYYEDKTFKNSMQKYDAVVHGLGADIHHNNSEYKFAYENADVNTKKPPLPADSHTDKLFLKYAYNFEDSIRINFNYLTIAHDNLAITDEGKSYGFGLSYKLKKKVSASFTQYYTNYNDFKLYQSDLKINLKLKLSNTRMKISSLTKYIKIKDKNFNHYTKNAQESYLTSGIKLHAHYKSYHLGLGAYLGEHAFAIMNDGFKIQHHAMEFDKTYAIGIGKTISNIVIRAQYVYQSVL